MNRRKREARNAYFPRVRQYVRPSDEPLFRRALQRYDFFLEALFLENEDLLDGRFEGLLPDLFSENCDE